MKTILYVFASILVITGLSSAYIYLKMPKKPSEASVLVENKIPLETYMLPPETEKKSEDPDKVIDSLDSVADDFDLKLDTNPKDDKNMDKDKFEALNKRIKELEDKEAQYQTQLNQKKYTKEIFKPSQPDYGERKTENENKIIQERIANQNLKIIPKDKIVVDYGVSEIKGEDKVDASNENKLFRTMLSSTKIPIILRENVSSTLAGSVTGIVRDNVYSYMGRAILIPKGSIAEGEYLSNNRVGEDRLQIVWTRIVTPQGVNIRFDSKTMDITGGSGAKGILDSKYWDRYGFALTLNTLTSLGMIGVSNFTQKVPNYNTQQILQQGVSDVNNINRAILQEQIKINPVINIRAGEIVFIKSNMDIFFPIPKGKEVMVEYFNRLKLDKQGEKQ